MGTTIQDGGMTALMDKMNPKTTGTTKTAVQETQDRFMTLLITQMKNQDPMNPLDNAQVTSQFAQLSTVTGIDKLNDTLGSLMSSYQASQTLQAASMIGHGVLSSGSGLDLVKSGTLPNAESGGSGSNSSGSLAAIMGVELDSAADKVSVKIYDQSGKAVRTLQMGPLQAGSTAVTWDGTADDGSTLAAGHYTFDVTATKNNAAVKATALQFGLVDTVSTDAKGVKLNVPGLGVLGMSDVRQIL